MRHNIIAARTWLALLGALALAVSPALAKDKKPKAPKPPQVAEQPMPGSVLTASEAALDCKKMAGRMQVRLLEVRGKGPSRGPSGAAQTLQSTVVPIFGGTGRGADAAGDRDTDIAKLKAMNDILIAKGCPHYDLDGELAKDDKGSLPRLQKAKAKPAKASAAKASPPPAR